MKLVSCQHHTDDTGYCVFSVAEAARKLNRSQTHIRRELDAAGVARVKGPDIAAFAEWPNAHGNLPVRLPVYRLKDGVTV